MRTGLGAFGLASLVFAGCQTSDRAGSSERVVKGQSAAGRAEAGNADAPGDPIADGEAELDAAAPSEPTDVAAVEPGAPPGYGQIRPTLPPPPQETLTVHGLAGYEIVAIYDRPDIEAPKLGYLRIGTRTMVTPKVEGPGCDKGFHGLPQGGFVCASKGFVTQADAPPPMFRPPVAPRVDQPLPYDYAYVRKWNSPMWWRIPNAGEIAEAQKQRAVLETQRLALENPEAAADPAKIAAGDTPPADPTQPSLPAVDEEPTLARADPKLDPPAEPSDTTGGAAAEPEPPIALPLNPADPWMEKGYYVSVSEKVTEEGRTWWKTARGGYVSTSDAFPANPRDFQGQVLAEEASFPFGFVWHKDGTKLYTLTPDGKLKPGANLEHRTFLDLDEETEVGGVTYMLTSDGSLVRKEHLRLAEPQTLPEGLQPWEKWIDVDLSLQMLVAYEGTQPVFTTLVSSGKKGTEEDPFETPTGRWRIRTKHVSTTMDGTTASDGNYSIQDVPWAMYFFDNYALHGAFWHEGFGRVRSHGCVNLGPTDARWLFFWTTPYLPEGWHGVHAHEGAEGTTVVVRE